MMLPHSLKRQEAMRSCGFGACSAQLSKSFQSPCQSPFAACLPAAVLWFCSPMELPPLQSWGCGKPQNKSQDMCQSTFPARSRHRSQAISSICVRDLRQFQCMQSPKQRIAGPVWGVLLGIAYMGLLKIMVMQGRCAVVPVFGHHLAVLPILELASQQQSRRSRSQLPMAVGKSFLLNLNRRKEGKTVYQVCPLII